MKHHFTETFLLAKEYQEKEYNKSKSSKSSLLLFSASETLANA